ncbi:MAG: S49 family peptidase, partial [Gammaproteobacteria bacterium]|nr:S49 family peptidase [Gammaproteobacteria bacterium]
GLFPTFDKTLAKIGVHSDGVGTTPLSDAFDVMRPMSPEMQQAFQLSVDNGYQQFIGNVARFRHMSVDAVNAIAQGRVWSGQEAKKLGLVDRFGNLQDAIAEAAKLAKLGPNYSVRYIERPLSLTDKLLISIANSNDSQLNANLIPSASLDSLPWANQLQQLTNALKVFSDPHGVYAYCFCAVQ